VPELPELQALVEGLDGALRGRRVEGVRIHHPATIRAADPPLEALSGRAIEGVWRRGKIIGVAAEGDLTLVIHLMQAGRLGIASPAEGLRSPRTAALDLDVGRGEVLRLRELSTHRRASAHLLDAAGLAEHRPLARLGPEPIGLGPEGWRAALSGDGAVLHSALRDGRRVAGIGRAYASDIMWAARLAPFARAASLDDEEVARLASAADAVLQQALERARERITTDLPNKEARVTAVHGHHGEPCLRCGTRLERVSFAEYELVYCPTCQTGGRVYRDRRMSRLLGAP
jgi:formamidopyrimidine-DNA glycosylase